MKNPAIPYWNVPHMGTSLSDEQEIRDSCQQHTLNVDVKASHNRIPKDIMYSVLATEHRPVGRHALRFKDVRKGNMKLTAGNSQQMLALAGDMQVKEKSWWAGKGETNCWRSENNSGSRG